jgi:hypothetical protein
MITYSTQTSKFHGNDHDVWENRGCAGDTEEIIYMCNRCIYSQYTNKTHILCIVAECSIDKHHSKEGSQEIEANSPETCKYMA